MLVTPDITLSYVNSVGQEMDLTYFSPFVCTGCDESVSNQVHSVKQPGTHGKFFTGMSLDEKFIQLSGEVRRDLSLATAERVLQNVFNPTLEGVLHFHHRREDVPKEIPCKVSAQPRVFWRGARLCFEIDLVCLDPFWKGQAVTELIAATMKEFYFPAYIPEGGMSFGTRRATLESEFENAGNVRGGFVATIRARGGTVLNPEIRNILTGERIRIIYNMRPDDVITIISTLQERRVLINGVNGFRHLDVDVSTFFMIDVGTNVIGYFADENVSNVFMSVRYIPNYTFAIG